MIVVCALVVPAVAYLLSARQPAQYAASADVYINQQNIASALTGISSYDYSSAALAVDTQASLAAVPAVAARALKVSKLSDRTADGVLAETTVTPNEATNILTFRVVDGSSTKAQLLATSYATAFTAYSNALQLRPVARARKDLEATMSQLQAEGRKGSSLYASLEEKDQQLQTLQTLQTSGTVVIRPAGPGVQIAPHPMKNAALGLILGLTLGLGLAFGLEALDTRVRTTGEIARGLGGLSLLARIPPPSKKMQKRNDLAMIVQPKHTTAEAYRLFRTNLDFVRLAAGDVRTILITSGMEQEGKSTTAANLAVAEARAGRRVALIDLDLRRPSIDRFFQINAAHGVTDVALGRIALHDALQSVDLNLGEVDLRGRNGNGPRQPVAENGVLDVLASGPLPPDPGEFAASHRLAEIIAQLHAEYEAVIIDTPPILRVGDALTLSSNVDGLIVVTRLKGLKRPMIRELRRVLDAVPTRKLGFVVTGPISGEPRRIRGHVLVRVRVWKRPPHLRPADSRPRGPAARSDRDERAPLRRDRRGDFG